MTSLPTPHSPSRLSRGAAALVGILLATAALFVPALPASAHDELVSTDPAADAVLDALPEQITFTFSADVLPDAGATVVEVKDASGASLTNGAPEVSGTTVTQSLTGSASGAVDVVWRVVSSDGHPIDGDFAFTVPAAAPTPSATATETEPAASPTSAAPTQSAAPSPSATESPVAETSAPSPLPWILLAVALVVVAGVVVYVFASRSGRNTAGGGTAGR